MNSKYPVNILLVDDEPANLLGLEALLGDLGENLIRANSGQEALKHMLTYDFALVLLDLNMPMMSGFEFAQLIRTRPQSQTTPIIFITASDPDEFPIDDAYALGAVDYLTKPIRPAVLRAKVAFFVELYRKTEDLARSERARHAAALNAKDERIRLILDNAKGYAFIVTDLDGRIIEWEGGAQAITGWNAKDVIGQPISILFTAEDLDSKIPQIEMDKAKATGLAEDKRWHLCKSGNQFFADGVTIPLTDPLENLHGYAKIFRDATVEKRAADEVRAGEAKLHESRGLFSLLLESSMDGIYGLGPDGNCTFLNASGAAMLGYRPDELIGHPLHDFIQHHHADGMPYPAVECRIAKAAREGISVRVEDEVFWRKDGTPIPVAYSVSPMIKNGRPAGAVITFSDITERKRIEEDLLQLATDLKEANQRKTEFLATLAHELRNPLAPIRSGLAVMRLKASNPATVAKVMDMMDRQVTNMVHLVDDLLDIARISSGKLNLKKEILELGRILSNAVETSLPLIESGQHELVVNVPEEALLVEVDATRISQVVSNLLNNAAKYTPAGGRIELAARQQGEEAVISVIDTGMGIPEGALATVFDMFGQIEQNLNRAQGGLGIGLSLVRQLVEMHEGTIHAASAGAGQGCTFTIRLPLAQSELRRKQDGQGPSKLATPLIAKARRVLVVDDNVDAATMLAMFLEVSGHDTQIAHNGPESLALAKEFRPDVIFLDIGMPGMNGYETAKTIRQTDGLDNIVMVALTGWGTERDRELSRQSGFDYHLTKPVELEAVNTLLAGLDNLTKENSKRLRIVR